MKAEDVAGYGGTGEAMGDTDKVQLEAQSNKILQEELEREKPMGLLQWYVVVLPIRTVGVMGDARTYEHVAVVRVVTEKDGAADWAYLPYGVLERISNRIVNEVRGINRVVYDITSKPPARVE